MPKKLKFISLFVFLSLLYSSGCFAAATNSCVTCHTNDMLMKSLYKPPSLPPSEGEG